LAKARNSIIISSIVLAFIAGTFVSGTQAFGAAQSGWQKAVDDLQDVIDAIGPHTVDTNAGTECAPGQFLNGDGSCDPVPTGDITSVIAGTGLTGGATSGDATLNVDTATIQQRVTGTCPPGQSIRTISESGAVICEVDNGSNLGVVRIRGPAVGQGTPTFSTTVTCPAGKVVTGGGVEGLASTSHLDNSFPISDTQWIFTVTSTAFDQYVPHIICIDNTPP